MQRDLLPLLEGSTVTTKHGNVNTDHILFIASGAFHFCKPSDLLAELQGRLPIRVELKPLTEKDMCAILEADYGPPPSNKPSNKQTRGHVFSSTAPHPAVVIVLVARVFTRRSAYTARDRSPTLPSVASSLRYTILTEPEPNLIKQQCALMFTEGVQLEFTDEAKWRMAKLATQINRDVENIGARRLHTIIERLMEDLSFSATDRAGDKA